MPARHIVRAQADANLVVPHLDGMVPVTAAPGRRARNLVDVVDQNIDVIDFCADAFEQRLDLRIIAMVTLNGAAFTTCLGDQACGENGPGRMLEAEELLACIGELFATNLLAGSRLLVTAGPTREAMDPVRYISNRSSGKMGFAVANAALDAGADVSIVSGPVSLTVPEQANVVNVTSAAEMHRAVMEQIGNTDIFISAAAVADYRLDKVSEQKIKKAEDEFTMKLARNPDILAEVAALEKAPFTVGFAAETENLEQNAQTKLRAKRLDMIAANKVGDAIGFDSEENALTLFWPTGQKKLALANKNKLARQLITIVAERYYEKNSDQTH